MFNRKLTAAISQLTTEVKAARQQQKTEMDRIIRVLSLLVTTKDLEEMEKRLVMKLSEIKSQIAAAAQKNEEAFQELGKKVTDLQKQIDDLIAGQNDPDVTDEVFLADLEKLKSTAAQLADIVPNTDTPTDPNAQAPETPSPR